jgi:small nuclear ribonucleoprotein (snRNP)-like protein
MSSYSHPNPNLLKTVHCLLGSNLHVTMTDGRTVRGKFLCLDRLGSILLEDVVERREIIYCPHEDEGDEGDGKESIYRWDTERSLSQVVIPGNRLVKVEIAKDEYQIRVEKLAG